MIRISIFGKSLRVDTVEKLVTKALADYPQARLVVERVDPPTTRAARLAEAISHVEDSRDAIQELYDELESWRDSLPEGLAQSQTADALDEAITNLEQTVQGLEDAISAAADVTFPGMYGR